MSKAFTKDESASEVLVVPRAPLAAGATNYVTPRGLRLLQEEQTELERQRALLEAADSSYRVPELNALAQRLAELHARVANAHVVEGETQPQTEARFGALVVVRHESGKESKFRIVGVDEADPARGLIAFSSPLARALLGKSVGELVELRTPRETEELELLSISYQHATD